MNRVEEDEEGKARVTRSWMYHCLVLNLGHRSRQLTAVDWTVFVAPLPEKYYSWSGIYQDPFEEINRSPKLVKAVHLSMYCSHTFSYLGAGR